MILFWLTVIGAISVAVLLILTVLDSLFGDKWDSAGRLLQLVQRHILEGDPQEVVQGRRPQKTGGQSLGRHASIVMEMKSGTDRKSSAVTASSQNPLQGFAIHLQWSWQPATHESLRQLAILHRHHAYQVRGRQKGRICYGLRLGFFPNKANAQETAGVLRQHFAFSRVVPIRRAESLASRNVSLASGVTTRNNGYATRAANDCGQ